MAKCIKNACFSQLSKNLKFCFYNWKGIAVEFPMYVLPPELEMHLSVKLS